MDPTAGKLDIQARKSQNMRRKSIIRAMDDGKLAIPGLVVSNMSIKRNIYVELAKGYL